MSKDASHPTPEPTVIVDPTTLPDDLATCHQLICNLLEAIRKENRRNEQLEHQLQMLLRARYGKKSEKLDPNQLLLFAMELAEEGVEPPNPEPPPVESTPRKPRSTTGRRPYGKNVPRRRVEHDLPEEQKACACCGQQRVRIGEEISEQIDYVPASVTILEHVRFKYACKHCQENVTTAPKPPQPIEKGLPTAGFLAHVSVCRFVDHLPYYRQEGIWARLGIDISRKLCRVGIAHQSSDLIATKAKLVGSAHPTKLANGARANHVDRQECAYGSSEKICNTTAEVDSAHERRSIRHGG